MLITVTCEDEIKKVKSYIHEAFTIKDLGYVRYFLGVEIARGSEGTYINQRKYILDILIYAGLLGSKPALTSLPKGHKFFTDQGEHMSDPNKYRRLTSRLLYLNFTQPDITYAVQRLSQFVGTPCLQYWNVVVHVLCYLKGSPSKGLFFPVTNSLQPDMFCDAGWASCPKSKRSLTSFCIMLGLALVSWRTNKQSTVACSSAKAEYRSMDHCMQNTVVDLSS